jgi:hypothetical protein
MIIDKKCNNTTKGSNKSPRGRYLSGVDDI